MERFLKEAEVFNPERVLKDITGIAEFHRIQGSKGLLEAAMYVVDKLRDWGIEAELLEDVYNGKKWHLTLKSPIAWDLTYAEVEIGERKTTTEKTPLVAMAHSPGGEAEGEMLLIEREDDWEKARGKIVLVGTEWRENYKRANKSGAKGFIAYRRGTGSAFPYIGLFLTAKDLEWAKIPAVAISEEWADEVIAKLRRGESLKAKLRVVSEIGEKQVLPMVYARVGRAPYVLFTAHLCHPKPGANDNASGSAMLMELARVLKGLYDDSFRFGFAFLWVPEYHGTQAFVEKAKLEDYYAVINLDMVAGSPDRSGSTIMAIRTPLSRFSIVSGLLEYFLERANLGGSSFSGSPMPRLPLRGYPYEMGSDHDVFNFFGIPSIMAITWPDRFYHSSEDTVEKLSRKSIEIIGKAATATALALAKAKREELQRFARGYTMKYLGELEMERDTEVSERLVMMGLARDSLFLDTGLGHPFEERGWLRWKRRGIINEKLIAESDGELVERFKKLTKDRKLLVQLHELLMLSEMLSMEEAFRALVEEYGSTDEEKLKEVLGILQKAGIIEET